MTVDQLFFAIRRSRKHQPLSNRRSVASDLSHSTFQSPSGFLPETKSALPGERLQAPVSYSRSPLAAARAQRPLWRAREHLFLTKARAAAHYWQAFACLVPSRLGFPRRLHREAADVVNKVLNYGYALLLSRVWVAVHRALGHRPPSEPAASGDGARASWLRVAVPECSMVGSAAGQSRSAGPSGARLPAERSLSRRLHRNLC